ncbi:hypothetical protein OS493_012384 [Desmophyllum pertusum]|uniref:Uncharacterized protein n=1 Tax=Desmophyllum pertusum TaxID=174260 RepID=A0A9W9ZRC3_9CNID|nr:hypothetical protein OS493_012384 [Desmophyllum pertusum]
MPKWSELMSMRFWAKRVWKFVTKDTGREDRVTRYNEESSAHKTNLEEKRLTFENKNNANLQAPEASTQYYEDEVNNLKFWMEHSSWTYCEKCKQLATRKMMHNYSNRPQVKIQKSCNCNDDRYVFPKYADIPEVLRGLTLQEIVALRPLDIHTGEYERHPKGYRRKGGMFRLTWSKESVEEKIRKLNDESRQKCRRAYNYLIESEESSYEEFLKKREECTQEVYNFYDYKQRKGVECCLWPHLYPFTSWCETVLDGRQSRMSSKVSFMTKLKSEIADYGMTHELLHFHYDLWLWQTVSGAIAQGRKQKCSPNKSLDNKAFSNEYWRWQHRYLVDAVRQFGTPHLFMTISPFEWSFPVPPWLNAEKRNWTRTNQTSRNPKEIKINALRADIPWDNPELAYHAADLQKSDKSALPINIGKTEVKTVNEKDAITFFHPPEAFAMNLRAYISTLLPSLKCRMDVQTSDGKGMLLKYASSYVSKWQDGYSNDALFSMHVTPYQAAYRHLRALRPLEPEMWMSLSNQKIAWTSSRTKAITVSIADSVPT